MEQPKRKTRRFKRQTRGDGPRKMLTRYKRDTKGRYLRDAMGELIEDYVEWRGHGYHLIDGERMPSRWVTAPTRAELNRILDRMLDEDRLAIAAGDYVITNGRVIPRAASAAVAKGQPPVTVLKMTLDDAIRESIESPRARMSEQTAQTYRQRWTYVHSCVHPKQKVPLGTIFLTELTYDHFAEWDRWLTDRLSPKTFAEVRNMLRAAVNFVKRNADLYPDVVVGFHPGNYKPIRQGWSTPQKRQDVAARDEYDQLADACRELIAEDPTYGWQGMLALITLVRHCIRPSEAVALKWTDWDDQASGFWIRRKIVALNGGEVVKDGGKTPASTDLVVIAKRLRDNISQSQTTGSIWVVPSDTDNNRWLSSSSRRRRWTILRTRAGIDPTTTLYTLKHGMIRDLFVEGQTADQIKLMTRHTTSKMINEVYATLEKTALSDIINKMHK